MANLKQPLSNSGSHQCGYTLNLSQSKTTEINFGKETGLHGQLEHSPKLTGLWGKVHRLSFPEVNCRKIPLQTQLSLMRKENN